MQEGPLIASISSDILHSFFLPPVVFSRDETDVSNKCKLDLPDFRAGERLLFWEWDEEKVEEDLLYSPVIIHSDDLLDCSGEKKTNPSVICLVWGSSIIPPRLMFYRMVMMVIAL